VLTSFRVAADGRVLAAPVARNLVTGVRRPLAKGCRVGVVRAAVRFELCGYPYVKNRVSTLVRVDSGGRRSLAGPAARGSHGPAGSWQSVALSPAGDRLLAQWSGECEIPAAFVIEARSGRARGLGRDRSGRQVEGLTLGWAGESALVTLPRAGCGSSAHRPGVYAFDRRGRARLVYAVPRARAIRVAMWHGAGAR
jgi:hypothetical protein